MKALSILQPYAWLIVNGHKPVENRTWQTGFRGPVLIHAGLKYSRAEHAAAVATLLEAGIHLPGFSELGIGGIVGQAEIVDCVTAHPSRWFTGPYGFVIRDAKPLPFVPWRGQLQFFDVPDSAVQSTPAETEAAGQDRLF